MAETPEYVRPPWTQEQVDALNGYQQAGQFHPFTCGGEHDHGHHVDLLATEDGWVCPEGCGYTQGWAHEFMLTPEAREPFHWPAPSGSQP